MEEHAPRRFHVSFSGRKGAQELSIVTPSNCAEPFRGPSRSPRDNNSSHMGHHESSILLIDKEPIDDFRRFRMLYVALILMVNTSTQGVFALYGLYMEKRYNYNIRTMVDIYTVGTSFGLFVFPFGALYDFFGPKIVIIVATLLTTLSHILFGLTFGDHIDASKTRFCVFFAMMNWGCYAFDVAVLPAVVTHMPRDRALPIGIVKTFSGLGPSVISCLFRGFFKNEYDSLMYFIASLVFAIGCVGLWYFEIAPYEVTRYHEDKLTLKDRLTLHLTRNRYMSQLLPTRRLHILGLILTLLNFFLTIQAVCAAYYADRMTGTDFKGIACGAIIIVALLAVLLVPLEIFDGPTAQDHEVIDKAREKAEELAERRKKRAAAHRSTTAAAATAMPPLAGPSHSPFAAPPDSKQEQEKADEEEDNKSATGSDISRTIVITMSVSSPGKNASPQSAQFKEEDEEEEEVVVEQPECDGPVDPNINLIPVSNKWLGAIVTGGEQEPGEEELRPSNSSVFRTSCVRDRNTRQNSEDIEVLTREQSTYNCPYVETITVCGEVFVTPVYETSFLQSLTYIDIWMLFYTTLVVWGVGLSLTANWNIKAMVATRYTKMSYKTYVLIAALTGVSMAGGRVVLGIYSQLLPRINQRFGLTLTCTVGLPFPSVCLTLALILYLALPGNLALIAVYVIAAFGFGFSTSITFYVISVIFKRDLGMHYGFCFTGAAIGVALLYRALFFSVYDKNKPAMIPLPPPYPPGMVVPNTPGFCFGDDCLKVTLIVYLILVISSFCSSLVVHLRYWKLVRGKLKYRRVSARIRNRWNRLHNGEK